MVTPVFNIRAMWFYNGEKYLRAVKAKSAANLPFELKSLSCFIPIAGILD